jgi:hypothetical protein
VGLIAQPYLCARALLSTARIFSIQITAVTARSCGVFCLLLRRRRQNRRDLLAFPQECFDADRANILGDASMSFSPHIAIKSKALAVAMMAKVNELAGDDVDDLRQIAEEALASDHPFFRAIMDFSTQHLICATDPNALWAAGEKLHNAIIADNNNVALVDDFTSGFGGFDG